MKNLFNAVAVLAVLGVGALAATPTKPRAPAHAKADAGVAAPDGGAKATEAKAAAQEKELASLREEVATLRDRTAALEDQLARMDTMNEQLGKLNDQVGALRDQVADAEATRKAEREQAAQHTADLNQAVEGLMRAESKLATGGTDIGSLLDRAQAVMTTPQAQYNLAAARTALANDDLQRARMFLYLAILDAQQGH